MTATRCLAVLLFLAAALTGSGQGKQSYDAPQISCAAGGSGATVNVVVTAGNSGAPAGFSIHWVLRSEYDQYGWSGRGNSYCEASFSGNARGEYYSLSPHESVTIPIGEPFTIDGASSRCDGVALACGQTYAFRVFAHGGNVQNRSGWSETTFCSTMPCAGGGGGGGENSGCTQTVDFWARTGPSFGEQVWQLTGLTLGNVFYTDVELEVILNTESNGKGLLELAQQLIAARLNMAAGADSGDIDSIVEAADAVIGNTVVGEGSLRPGETRAHISALLAFNQGSSGPGSCE